MGILCLCRILTELNINKSKFYFTISTGTLWLVSNSDNAKHFWLSHAPFCMLWGQKWFWMFSSTQVLDFLKSSGMGVFVQIFKKCPAVIDTGGPLFHPCCNFWGYDSPERCCHLYENVTAIACQCHPWPFFSQLPYKSMGSQTANLCVFVSRSINIYSKTSAFETIITVH